MQITRKAALGEVTNVGDVSTFKEQVGGVCPFCQKRFAAGADAKGNFGIVHEMPMCKTFEDLDIAEYLKAVRLKYSD